MFNVHIKWQFPGYLKDLNVLVLLKYVWSVPSTSFGWFWLFFYDASLIMTRVEWRNMAYIINLYYPTEQVGSMFSHFWVALCKHPLCPIFSAKLVALLCVVALGLFFFRQKGTHLSIQSIRTLNYSLKMCVSLLFLDCSNLAWLHS